MAEPLGIIASIFALVKATKVVVKIVGDIKDCPSECSRMLVELSMTAGLLGSLRYMLEKDTERTRQLMVKALDQLPSHIQELERIIKTIASKLVPKNGLLKVGRAIAWPFRKGEIDHTLQEIERLKSNFILALEISSA